MAVQSTLGVRWLLFLWNWRNWSQATVTFQKRVKQHERVRHPFCGAWEELELNETIPILSRRRSSEYIRPACWDDRRFGRHPESYTVYFHMWWRHDSNLTVSKFMHFCSCYNSDLCHLSVKKSKLCHLIVLVKPRFQRVLILSKCTT